MRLPLLLPHLAAWLLLEAELAVAWLVSVVGVLATGRYPPRAFAFMEGAGRFMLKVLAFALLLTDDYPPMALYTLPGDSVRFRLDYPFGGRVSRWRPLFAWVLVLPQYALLIVGYVAAALLALAAMFSILLRGSYPRRWFRFAFRVLSFHARLNAYGCFMIDRYPGFRF